MFSQDDIDAVLNDAEQAVNSLADQTDALTGPTAAPAATASRPGPRSMLSRARETSTASCDSASLSSCASPNAQ